MTIKDSSPVKLIEHYIHKEEQQARLITIHELATKLLAKQEATATESKAKPPKSGHAKYEWLRPMYRTVHRTKPREMVLRAIRWVNPKRMFPIMSWDDKKLDSLSLEEFEAAFSELAKIRREAHVISNRYDQMLNAIKAGQLPYHIPYANINYMSLAEHEDRATRLGAGAEDWGWEIDQKAEEFREKFEGKDWREDRQKQADAKTGADRPLVLTVDSIDSLWEDGAPPFMRTREGRKGERLMRARRQNVTRFNLNVTVTDADGEDQDLDFTVHAFDQKEAISRVQGAAKRAGGSNVTKIDVTKITKGDKIRMPTRAKIWAQEFVAVPEIERRPGEEIRIPRGNLKGMIRIPAKQPSWMSDAKWKDLQDTKKGTFGPRGKKIELSITPLDFYDTNIEIALRREERWTQRALAPHRGAASQAPGGHGAEEAFTPQVTPAPQAPPSFAPTSSERKAQQERREAQLAARKKQQEEAQKKAAADPTSGHAKGTFLLTNQALEKAVSVAVPKINDFIVIDAPDDFDPATFFTTDNIKSATLTTGGILNKASTFVVTDNTDQKWLVKAAPFGENVKELAVVAIDRALGINVCPRIMLANNVSTGIWSGADDPSPTSPTGKLDAGRIPHLRRQFEDGEGHIGEWVNKESKMVDKMTFAELKGTISTPEQRARWYGIALVDAVTGNWDSWGNNLMFKPGVGVFSIDNGLAFDNGLVLMMGNKHFGQRFAPGAGHPFGRTAGLLKGSFDAEGFDGIEMRKELNDWFEKTWDPAAIQKAAESTGVSAPMGGWDTLSDAPLQKDFVDKMMEFMYDQSGSWGDWKAQGKIPDKKVFGL